MSIGKWLIGGGLIVLGVAVIADAVSDVRELSSNSYPSLPPGSRGERRALEGDLDNEIRQIEQGLKEELGDEY